MKDSYVILILLAVIVAAFFVGRMTVPDGSGYLKRIISDQNKQIVLMQEEFKARIVDERKIDTVVKYSYLYRKPITVSGVATVQPTGDSSRSEVESPFVATLDTIVGCDTMQAKFKYPEMLLSVALSRCMDSIPVQTITIETFQTKVVARPLWVDILSHTGAAVVASLITWAIVR